MTSVRAVRTVEGAEEKVGCLVAKRVGHAFIESGL